MNCPICRDAGYAWGGSLHRPELRRCRCQGGPPDLWERWRPPEEKAEAEVPMTTLAMVRRKKALRGGSAG